MPPHIFAIAEGAYQNMINGMQDVNITILCIIYVFGRSTQQWKDKISNLYHNFPNHLSKVRSFGLHATWTHVACPFWVLGEKKFA